MFSKMLLLSHRLLKDFLVLTLFVIFKELSDQACYDPAESVNFCSWKYKEEIFDKDYFHLLTGDGQPG